MEVVDLENLFKMYEKEALDLKESNGYNELFNKIYINLFQTRNIVFYLSDNITIEKAQCHKALKKFNDMKKYSTKDYIFYLDLYMEKAKVQDNVLRFEEMIEQQVLNHNKVAFLKDYDMLPYHYAIVCLLNMGILNQDNHNEELTRKVTCYKDNCLYQEIYKDQANLIIPFIKEKQDNMIIANGIFDSNYNTIMITKNKRFPN